MFTAFTLLVLFLCVAAILSLFSSNTLVARSSELGFTSLSPRGASGGSIVPASCESGYAHTPGECAPPPPATPTASLSANPSTIDSGQSSNLFWTSTDATSCTSAGGFDTGGATTNPPGGVATGVLTATTTYQITCSKGALTSAPSFATVAVRQPTVTITANPNRVNTGTGGGGGGSGGSGGSATTTISWNATNVNTCAITRNGATWMALTADAGRIVSGSTVDTITTQTVYRMSCTNDASGAGGVAAAAATQIVNIISSFQEF